MRTFVLATPLLLLAPTPPAGACTVVDPCFEYAGVEYWEVLSIEQVEGDPDALVPEDLERVPAVEFDGYGSIRELTAGDLELSSW